MNTVLNTASIGQTMVAKAASLAAGETKDIKIVLSDIANAKEVSQGGPLKVMVAMAEWLGDKMDELPEPDSEEGNNPDKFKVPVVGKDGTSTMRPTSFYVKFYDNMEEGKAIIDVLDQIARAGDEKAIKDGISAEILKLNPVELKNRKEYWEGRRGTQRSAVKKAVALYYQFTRVQDLPNVHAEPLMDGDTIRNTPRPIWVFSVAGKNEDGQPIPDPQKWTTMSIGGFMGLDVGKAQEMVANNPDVNPFDALKSTVGRQGGAGQGKTKDGAPLIKTVSTFLDFANSMATYVSDAQDDPKQTEVTAVYKALTGPGSDDNLLNMGQLYFFLHGFMQRDKLLVRYQGLLNDADEGIAKQKIA